MSHTDLTVKEAIESVTGYDEIAVRSHFDLDVYTDREAKPMMATRALVFVIKRREGMSDREAKAFAMDAPMRLINNEFFSIEDDDQDPDDPDSESGKGEPAPERAPSA